MNGLTLIGNGASHDILVLKNAPNQRRFLQFCITVRVGLRQVRVRQRIFFSKLMCTSRLGNPGFTSAQRSAQTTDCSF